MRVLGCVTPSLFSSMSLFLFPGISLLEVKWGPTSCQPLCNEVLITSTACLLGCSLQSRFPELRWRAWSSGGYKKHTPIEFERQAFIFHIWPTFISFCPLLILLLSTFLVSWPKPPFSSSSHLCLYSLNSFPFSLSSSVSVTSLWLLNLLSSLNLFLLCSNHHFLLYLAKSRNIGPLSLLFVTVLSSWVVFCFTLHGSHF